MKFRKYEQSPSAELQLSNHEKSEFDNFGEYDSEMNREEEEYDYGQED